MKWNEVNGCKWMQCKAWSVDEMNVNEVMKWMKWMNVNVKCGMKWSVKWMNVMNKE